MRYQILLAVGIALASLAFPAVARADCQPASSIKDALATAEIAFVGTVVAAVDGGPRAVFSVEEVWVGQLLATAEVRGLGDAGFMEDDRQWTVGVRYLVIPFVEAGLLRDTICSATSEWRDELAALRPPTAHPPGGLGTVSDVPVQLLLLGGAAALIAVVSFAAFRHRAGPRRTRDPGE
jgi:hypothetical protein